MSFRTTAISSDSATSGTGHCKVTTPPNKSPAENARRAISAVFFVNGAALGGWVPYVATVRDHLRLTDGQIGLALLMGGVGAVTTMPFGGRLIQRFGSRQVLSWGAAGLLLTLPLLLWAPTLGLFLVSLYAVGVFTGEMDVAMNAHSVAVQRLLPRPMLSAVHGWFSVGGFAGAALNGVCIKLGFSPVTHLVAASVALAAVMSVAVPHLLGADADHHEDDQASARLALPRGPLLLIGTLTLISFMAEGALWDWAAVYLRSELRSSPSVGALGFAAFAGATAVTRFVGDGVIRRWGHARLIASSAVLASVGTLLAVSVPVPAAAIIGFAVVGLGLGNLVPLLFKAAGHVRGISAGEGLAAVTTCGYTGLLLGPPAMGLVSDRLSLRFAFLLVAVAMAGVAIFGPRRVSKLDAENP